MLNGSRYEKILVTMLPDADDDGAGDRRAGLVLSSTTGTFGWYHWLLQSVGILGETSILGSPDTAMLGIVLVDVWQWTPLITLITLAGLKRVPQRPARGATWSTAPATLAQLRLDHAAQSLSRSC